MTLVKAWEEDVLLTALQASDEIVFKSITCTHTHTRWHEYEDAGITTTGSYEEATAGGISTTFAMPNTKPAMVTLDLVNEFLETVKDAPGQHYVHFGARDDNFEECEKALADPRVVSLKIYPAWKNESGEEGVVTTSFAGVKAEVFDHSPEAGSTLDTLGQLCIKHNKPMIVHCETPNKGHAPIAEEHYIQHTVLPLCKRLPHLKFVVAHVTLLSTAENIIACNKEFDTNIYMELTPHHLWWDEDDIQDNFLECFPRIRSRADRDGLRMLFAQIGKNPACKFMHGTDHAPHSIEAKINGSRGIPNLHDSVAMIMTIATSLHMTTGQLQQFFRGIAEECYPFLAMEEASFTTLTQSSYVPGEWYYNGAVKNPLYGEKLLWKVTM